MPELPEVENVRRCLEKSILGTRLLGCVEHFPGILVKGGISPKKVFPTDVTGLHRHGKYLQIDLENGRQLVVHFRMTGCFYFRAPTDPLHPHTHVEFPLNSGELLAYRDPRRFGRLWLIDETVQLPMHGLGPDALTIPEGEFLERVGKHNRMIKPLLLDQTVLAGIGNIYADESLFLAGIHPQTSSNRLRKSRLSELWRATKTILERAIETGGSSISDYVSPEGIAGSYQNEHGVYDREGQPCPCCGDPIKRIVVGQRGTHFCPRCQKRR
jgi:formamidopyrimidine-DNA glycosylase